MTRIVGDLAMASGMRNKGCRSRVAQSSRPAGRAGNIQRALCWAAREGPSRFFAWARTKTGDFHHSALIHRMLGWSLNLFRIRGIQLAVHFSFVLLLGYVAWEGWQQGASLGLWWSVATIL